MQLQHQPDICVYIGKRVGVHAQSRQFTSKSDGVTPGVNGVNWRDVGVNGVNWRDARREWRIDVTPGVVGVTLGVTLGARWWRSKLAT